MPAKEDRPLKKVTVRLYQEDLDEIKAEAARQGVNFHWLLRQATSEGWQKMKSLRRIAEIG